MTSSARLFSSVLSRRAFCGAAFVALCAAQGCAIFHRPKPIEPAVFKPAVSKNVGRAIKEATRLSLLEEEKDEKPTICFIGVLGESADAISTATRDELELSNEIKTIDKNAMKVALKESGIKASEVYIPNKRKLFVESLGESFDYLLAGYVERVEERVDPDDEESATHARTVYRLELVNLETNKKSEFVADL